MKNKTGIGSIKKLALADLKRSGLDKRDYKKLHLKILSRDETDEFVGEPRASYKIPYFDIQGTQIPYARVRFLENSQSKGFKKGNKGNSFRYSQPANSTPHIYFPPLIDWAKVAKDPTIPILITEGEKKAAAACKQGIVCMALGGVYGFMSSKRLWDIIPEFKDIDWKDREVEICYDSDVMWKAEVRNALYQLSYTLAQEFAPASISFIYLDAEVAGKKTGLDDYLLENGSKGFKEIPRTEYRISAKIQALNQKVCYVEKHAAFFNIKFKKYFRNWYNVKEAFITEGEETVDGKTSAPVIELWLKSPKRRTVLDVVYRPGEPETTANNELNLWVPPLIQPKAKRPRRWLELVEFILRKPRYMDWFLKWLAYPVQNPGTKLFQAVFVFGEKQGIGKTFIVDPVMEEIYGKDNFLRLSNNALQSEFNSHDGKTQFIVTNEIYFSEFRDRRSIMSNLKDMVTREDVEVNEKFQPKVKMIDYANYYLTSNHADSLVLEPNDRRFFVIEAPNEKLDQGIYDELDDAIRNKGGSCSVLHYLKNHVDTRDFNPKADAPMTEWKQQVIGLSADAIVEFRNRMIESPEQIMGVSGQLPDQHLYRAEDLLRIFEKTYPKFHFTVTVQRMARVFNDQRIEHRKVRRDAQSPLLPLYCLFDREAWRGKKNREWAEHYQHHSKFRRHK